MKYNVSLSEAMCGTTSKPTPFTNGARLAGVDQGSSTVSRVAVHKSFAPKLEDLVEEKNISSPRDT
jgi:hypothetical protein